MIRILLALALVHGAMCAQAQTQPTNLIPNPVAYSARPGSVCRDKIANLHQKVRISEKVLLRHLEGQKLTDWQLKSAYWLEVGKKGVKVGGKGFNKPMYDTGALYRAFSYEVKTKG